MNIFGFASPSADISIIFDDEGARPKVSIRASSDKRESVPLFSDGESVSGKIFIRVKEGKRIEHHGIKVELVGDIEYHHPGERIKHNEFLSLAQELSSPGEIRQPQQYEFEFKNIDKPYESYTGSTVSLKYFVRVVISKRISDIAQTKLFWVRHYSNFPVAADLDCPINMEVGVEDCLHIEFKCEKSVYHLNDVLKGYVKFHMTKIKIYRMDLSIIRREITGAMPHPSIENTTIAKYEIMDGHPGKDEIIPIRVYLAGFELSPTFQDVNKKFSVRYFINLVLIDEEGRRYFKQHEIIVYRRRENDINVLIPNMEMDARIRKNLSVYGSDTPEQSKIPLS